MHTSISGSNPPDFIAFLLLCKHRSGTTITLIDVMSIPTMKKERLTLRGNIGLLIDKQCNPPTAIQIQEKVNVIFKCNLRLPWD